MTEPSDDAPSGTARRRVLVAVAVSIASLMAGAAAVGILVSLTCDSCW